MILLRWDSGIKDPGGILAIQLNHSGSKRLQMNLQC
jgi:hypothetical protein